MTTYVPIVVLSLLFVGCVPLLAMSSDEPRVFVHYMPWFKAEPLPNGETQWAHWEWFQKGPKHDPDELREDGKRDIASVYYPLVGPYDGRDADVLEYHMLTARAAGIDGFIADWYGPRDHSDKVFGAMVKAAEKYGMKVGICLEEKTFFPPYSNARNRAEAMDVMEKQMRYVLEHHAKSDAYLRYNGKPVFFVFIGYEETPIGKNVMTPDELADVLDRLGKDELVYVYPTAAPGYMELTRACYVWNANGQPREPFYQVTSAARQRGELDFVVGGAYPGFDDTGVWGWGRGPRITDRRGTKEYDENWQEALRYEPHAIQVATWNDFGEGTTIEPTDEYGYEFIDLTEKYVERFTGRTANAEDNRWAYRIYKLRQALKSVEDEQVRRKWSGKVDAYAGALGRGSRFLMGWKLKRLESGIGKQVGTSE